MKRIVKMGCACVLLLAGCQPASPTNQPTSEPTASTTATVSTGAIVAPTSSNGAVAQAYSEEASQILETVNGDLNDSDALLLHAGESLPDLTFTDYNGNAVNLQSFVGKKVIIELMANWCSHCQNMNRDNLATDVTNNPDVQFIQMFYNGSKDDIQTFYQDTQTEMQPSVVIFPESQELQQFGLGMGLTMFPSFFFFDEEGKLSWVHVGELSEAQIEAAKPYAFGDQPRIYSFLKEGEDPASYYRVYSDLRNDLTPETQLAIDAQDTTGNYLQMLYEIISQDCKVSGQVEDSLGNVLDYDSQTAGKTIVYQYVRSDANDDYFQAIIPAVNALAKEKDLIEITVIVEGSQEASQWYNALPEKPEGYVFYQAEGTVPETLMFSQMQVAPAQIYINGDTGRAMGISFASTDEQLQKAYQLYCGETPAYQNVTSTAKTIQP